MVLPRSGRHSPAPDRARTARRRSCAGRTPAARRSRGSSRSTLRPRSPTSRTTSTGARAFSSSRRARWSAREPRAAPRARTRSSSSQAKAGPRAARASASGSATAASPSAGATGATAADVVGAHPRRGGRCSPAWGASSGSATPARCGRRSTSSATATSGASRPRSSGGSTTRSACSTSGRGTSIPTRLSDDEVADLREQSRGSGHRALVRRPHGSLCRQVRAAPGFERSRYLDARKENQTRTELATFRGDDLGYGGHVRRSRRSSTGRAGSGARVRARSRRSRATSRRRHRADALALLLGDVTRRNTPTRRASRRGSTPCCAGEPGEARIGRRGRGRGASPARHGRNVQSHALDAAPGEGPGSCSTGSARSRSWTSAPAGSSRRRRGRCRRTGETSSAVAELTDLKGKRKELAEPGCARATRARSRCSPRSTSASCAARASTAP